MTISISSASPRRRLHGSAIFIVLTLLAVMSSFVVYNNVVLHGLKRELKLIDARQQAKFKAAAPAAAAQPHALKPADEPSAKK